MLPSLLGFILLPLYSRYLSTGEYGIVAAMGIFSTVVAAVSTLALDRAAMRFYFDSSNQSVQKENMGTFFLGSLSSATMFFAILIIAAPLVEKIYPDIEFFPYYFSALLTVTIGVCGNFVLAYYRISEKSGSYLGMISLTVMLQLVFTYYFIVVEEMGALGQLLSLLTTTILLLPIYLIVAYRNFLFNFNWAIFKQGLSFSWPLIPTLIVAWILNWSDGIFIAHHTSLGDVGIYAMGYKISMLLLIVSGAFATAYSPVFFKKANQENQFEAKASIYLTIQIASKVFIFIGFITALFSLDLIKFFLDEKYLESYKIVRIVVWAHVFSAIMGISSNLYYQQTKRNKLQLAVVSFSAILSLILNYIFVPLFGIYGAAFVSVFAMLVLTLMHYHFSKKCYFVEIHWSKLFAWILVAILMVLIAQLTIEKSIYSFQLKTALVLLIIILTLRSSSIRKLISSLRLS